LVLRDMPVAEDHHMIHAGAVGSGATRSAASRTML
jgi:hypothetical protein